MFGPSRRVARRTARRTSRRQMAMYNEPEPQYAEPQYAEPQYAAPPPPPAAPDYGAELQKLASLRDQGIINDSEFEAKKKQILGL
jgi:Short C-terminal domain